MNTVVHPTPPAITNINWGIGMVLAAHPQSRCPITAPPLRVIGQRTITRPRASSDALIWSTPCPVLRYKIMPYPNTAAHTTAVAIVWTSASPRMPSVHSNDPPTRNRRAIVVEPNVAVVSAAKSAPNPRALTNRLYSFSACWRTNFVYGGNRVSVGQPNTLTRKVQSSNAARRFRSQTYRNPARTDASDFLARGVSGASIARSAASTAR